MMASSKLLPYNSRHVVESRDLHRAVPYLEFEFEFTPPKPRYTRIILQRDEFGRIVHSKSPQIQN